MPVHHYCYGSICNCDQEWKVDHMPDIERTASRGESSPLVSTSTQEKDIAMRPLADQASDQESIVSEESYDSCQAGVKRLEAISSTWTKRGLYVAYLGCVCPSHLLGVYYNY